MSDYLWDKTGESDEEVERLEGLLAAFRHEPRALELPAAAAPRAGAKRAAWLAFAAALLLAVLAGALTALRRPEGQDSQRAASQAPAAATPSRADAPPAPSPKAGDEKVAFRTPEGPRHARQAPKRQRKVTGGAAQVGRDEESEGGGGRAEVAASLARGFSVKAQLVNALRLTGTKLKEVQRKALGPEEREDTLPTDRNRSR